MPGQLFVYLFATDTQRYAVQRPAPRQRDRLSALFAKESAGLRRALDGARKVPRQIFGFALLYAVHLIGHGNSPVSGRLFTKDE